MKARSVGAPASAVERPPAAGGAAPAAAVASTPHANRGCVHIGTYLGARVDWLTVTVGLVTDARLRAALSEELRRLCGDGEPEARGRVKGFGGLEVFEWPGAGAISRRFAPSQPSKMFGTGYASWEAPGAVAAWLVGALLGDRDEEGSTPPPARCTRVDVAFDWAVDEEFAPVNLRECIRGAVEQERGLEFGHAGSERHGSVYVNKHGAPRQLCIYRRDWRSTRQRGVVVGGEHILRQEIRLRAGRAQQAWRELQRGDASLHAYAALQLRDLTGQEVDECGGAAATALEMRPRRFVTGAAWLLRQHAGTLHHLIERVDAAGFASLVELAYRRASPQSQARARKCAELVKDRTAADLCAAIESQLAFT